MAKSKSKPYVKKPLSQKDMDFGMSCSVECDEKDNDIKLKHEEMMMKKKEMKDGYSEE